MRRYFKKTLLFFTIIAVLLSGCGTNSDNGGSNNPDYISNVSLVMKSQLSTIKVLQDEDISALDSAKIDISLAKGETEGAQFIVRPDMDVSSYSVVVSDLICGNSIIEKNNITVYTMLYSYAGDKAYGGILGVGYYPDAAIPVEYIINAGENSMTKDLNQGFWVDVTAPNDVSAGDYSGNIVIVCDNKSFTVPVSVKVYDFTINDYPFMQSCYEIWQGWLMYSEHDATDEMYMNYYDMLADYNVYGYTFPHTDADEFLSYVKEYYPKISSFGIPYDALSNTENDWTKFQTYMDALAIASVEDNVNYFDKAYYYLDLFYDEYKMVDWRKECVRRTYENCDLAEEKTIDMLYERGLITDKNCELALSIKDLRHTITTSYDEEFSDIFNSYCPGYSLLKSTAEIEEIYRQISEDDIVYWSYGCVGTDHYPCASREINENLTSTRDLYWFNYQYDIIGDLYWCINAFCNVSHYNTDGYALLNDLYRLASHDGVTNGDGYLVYPAAPYGSEKPFPSLRLIAIRDGIDDNTYMCQLGNIYKELSAYYGADIGDAKNFISFLNKEIISKGTSKLNDIAIQEGRNAIANAIVAANDCKFIIDSLSLEGNAISYRFYSDNDTTVKVNGAAVNGINAGNGKTYAGIALINENTVLNIELVKNGKTYNISINTPKEVFANYNFDNSSEIQKLGVYDRYGSSLSVDGNKAKAVLKGHNFANPTTNSAFKPRVTFNLASVNKPLSEVSCVELYVYNAESYDCRYEVVFYGTEDGISVENRYDIVNCKAGEWTKIVIDNFSSVNLNKEKLNIYDRVGLRTESNLLDGSSEQTRTLYIDKIIVR